MSGQPPRRTLTVLCLAKSTAALDRLHSNQQARLRMHRGIRIQSCPSLYSLYGLYSSMLLVYHRFSYTPTCNNGTSAMLNIRSFCK